MLVVDDEQKVADVQALTLRHTYETRVAYGGREALEKYDVRVSLAFDPYEAVWLVFDPDRTLVDPDDVSESVVEVVATVDSPWRVSYDPDAQPRFEHPIDVPADFHGHGTVRSLGGWHDDWLLPESFSGRLDYETTLTVEEPERELLADLGRVYWAAEVWTNGERAGDTLWPPHRVDVTDVIQPSENEFRARVANLVNNNYGQPRESGLLGPVELLSPR